MSEFIRNLLSKNNQEPERSKIVQKFSKEARRILEDYNYYITNLAGASIEKLVRAGYLPFPNSLKDRGFNKIISTSCLEGEVAVHPWNILTRKKDDETFFDSSSFLPGSNEKTFDEQKKIIESLSKQYRSHDFIAAIGSLTDYVGVIVNYYYEKKRDLILPQDFYTSTTTNIGHDVMAVGGSLLNSRGLNFERWNPRKPDHHIFVLPLILPISQ